MYLKNYELDERQFESQVEDELPDEGQREAGRAVGRYLEGELVRPLMILSSKVNHLGMPRGGGGGRGEASKEQTSCEENS